MQSPVWCSAPLFLRQGSKRLRLSSSSSFPASQRLKARHYATPTAGIADVEDTFGHHKVIRNDAGVQLLSPFMHRQVFGDGIHPPLDQRAVSIAKAHLAVNGLAVKESPVISAKDFILPPLLGESIEQHFDKLGYITSEPYLGLANELAEVKLPPKPDTWQKVSGWTRYDADGSFEFVRYPEEDAIVFDVETLYKLSPYAVMAAAVSEKHWYSWVSPWLLGESEDALHLIPMHSEQTTLIVGHNVGYDRARIDGEYDLQGSKNRFLDTMSLHCAVKGLTSHQRAPWMKHRKNQRLAAEGGGSEGASESAAARISRWEDHSSMNSLADVAELHCGIKVDKTARDWFSSLDKADIVTQFQDLMSYCAGDVDVTHRVFRKVFPAFRRACPSPVSFSGILQMGSSFLPVDVSWEKFIGNADRMYSDLTAKVESELHQLAEQARRSMFDMDADNPGHYRHETDPWLSQLDWTPKKARGLSRGKAKSIDLSKVPSAEFNAEADVSADVEDQQSAKPSHDDLAIGTPVEGASGNEVSDAVLASQHPSEPDSDQLSRAAAADAQVSTTHLDNAKDVKPDWYTHTFADEGSAITRYALESVLPYLLRLEMHGYPVAYLEEYGWCARVPKKEGKSASAKFAERVGTEAGVKKYQYFRLGKVSRRSLFNASALKAFEKGVIISPHAEIYRSLASVLSTRATVPATVTLEHAVLQQLRDIADGAVADAANVSVTGNPWMSALDWTVTQSPQEEIQEESASSHAENEGAAESTPSDTGSETSGDRTDVIWPQWYWDMAKPRPNETGLNLSIRSRAAPLLLRLQWENHILFHSRQFGWVYRKQKRQDTDPENTDEASLQPVRFSHAADDKLANDMEHDYYKLPHKDGAEANVGSPLSKTFIPAFEEGILSSEFAAAKAALSMNAQCSYWISARERVINQLVIWQDPQHQRGFPPPDARVERYGMILPQVVTMGTVTRRAVESTWLAASNAKKNRLGSELKAMVRAPEGYAIVGADVDSEELWICCVMGDAQFGLHGATAVGWMTLEGTKSAGTDLHSKTASILGITRDMAKVFNYSRIYGAGVKHAVQLLMQSNPKLSKADATDQANRLYAATKGLRDFKAAKSATGFARANGKFWYGGTESHVFNTLEEIAMAKRPRTPALGCGITAALAKENLPATEKSRAGEDFMPSRINWVVQSSGVDYLHMLIASMKYLTDTYNIDARFMISVHDEIRYLVKAEDRFRAALALQISNLWTRALFSYRLEMESLPQSCAFFSAVDIDHVLRKEVNMDCVTPSQPVPIPHGVSQNIDDTLASTQGTLFSDGRQMPSGQYIDADTSFEQPRKQANSQYRAQDIAFLQAQAARSKEDLAAIMRHKAQNGFGDAFSELAWPFIPPPQPAKRAKRGSTAHIEAGTRDTGAAGERPARSKYEPGIVDLPLRRSPSARSTGL